MNKKRKIGIIGIGNVGAHVASSIVTQGICNELILLDCIQQRAKAHAEDIADSCCYMAQDVDVRSGDYGDLGDADLLVISAASSILDEDRLKELDKTIEVMDDIIPNIKASGFKGIILSISNPCDIIAEYLQRGTGLKVIGTGTMLDTARLKLRIARKLGVDPKSVQGYVLGEHGDSQMVPWSLVEIGGIPIRQFDPSLTETDLKQLAAETAKAGWQIVMGKGCTEFGIGAACAALAKAVLEDEKTILPVSNYIEEYGVYTSIPWVIGADGAERKISVKLTEAERIAFEASCKVLAQHKAKYIK